MPCCMLRHLHSCHDACLAAGHCFCMFMPLPCPAMPMPLLAMPCCGCMPQHLHSCHDACHCFCCSCHAHAMPCHATWRDSLKNCKHMPSHAMPSYAIWCSSPSSHLVALPCCASLGHACRLMQAAPCPAMPQACLASPCSAGTCYPSSSAVDAHFFSVPCYLCRLAAAGAAADPCGRHGGRPTARRGAQRQQR